MSSGTATLRGTTACRGCDRDSLVSILDLGEQPLSNGLLASPDVEPDRFPLHLRLCTRCGLGQVGEYVSPSQIFGDDYPYLSSTSSSWVAHARRYANAVRELVDLGPSELVVEVASNDGYLLSAFQEQGVRVLGIEPAANVAAIARAAGVPTVGEFFGAACARRVVAEHGHPRLVAANNVMAHVPDLHDFVAGIAVLCDDRTLVTVENPSLISILRDAQFDTIYHEHFSYLTATSVQHVARAHGLDLVRVETLSTHGGSNRYFLRRAGSASPDETVATLIGQERRDGLFDLDAWAQFSARCVRTIDDLRDWLTNRREEGARVAGYGAAAKGNTLLNAVGDVAGHLSFVVDASPEKQGRFMPGPQVAIVAPSRLESEQVDDIVILPWNLATELLPIVRELSPSSAVWIATPRLERLA